MTQDLPLRFEQRLLPVDEAIAFQWGRLIGAAKREGRGRSVMDGWIAASAQVRNLVLVTRNIRDFAGTGIALLAPRTGNAAGPA